MVDFPAPGGVFGLAGQQARGFGDQVREDTDSYREIGAPDEAGAGFFDGGAGAIELGEPAGGADHDVDAEIREAFDIFGRGCGRGEFHGGVDAAEIGGGEAFEVRVVVDIETQLHVEAVFGREALDDVSHFAVTDDCQVHVPRFVAVLEVKDEMQIPRCARDDWYHTATREDTAAPGPRTLRSG